MTDILCKWLNEELRLSQVVEPKTFARAFSSGYLFGEILHKYQLQNDFHMFMKKERSISMLNNFTRLEPSLHLLGIPFSATTAQEVMQEKPGASAHIVHQLYISLERKKKGDISETTMKVMQPTAVASLHRKEHEIYCDRLHKVVKREAQVDFQRLSKFYEDKVQQISKSAVQQKKATSKQEEKSKRIFDKVQTSCKKSNEPMPSNQISAVQRPKPLTHFTQLNLRKQQQQQRLEKQAQNVQNEIAEFETKRRLPSSSLSHLGGYNAEVQGIVSKPELLSNSAYIQQIRQRLEEDALAREQRDKRIDRFLSEQAKAREAEQNAKHEEYLIKRYTRPTKQEQRLVAQLLQIKKQKEVFINNRLFREQQIQERREKDLQEAEKRAAVLAEQERMARAEEIKRTLDFCSRLAADRDQIINQKRAKSCKEIVEQIVDLATKAGEYRLSGNPVPVKQIKEWKEVLFGGLPLYESINEGSSAELKKQDILNNLDYDEYINMTGEWMWSEEGVTKLPPTNNGILGSVVARLRKIVHPPREKPVESPFPFFSLKACVLGKLCSGKSSCLAKIAQAHGIHILSASALVNEAINAYNAETATKEQELSNCEKEMPTNDNEAMPQDVAITKLSTRAMYGREADKEMMDGNTLPQELLLKIITEAIQQLPANSAWILDGFPVDITQAHLLEEALVGGGAEEEECAVTDGQANLALDPDPPKAATPPPPALDLALLLDLSDECAVSRAVDLAYAAATDSEPDNLYMSQIPHRVTAFQETWPKLEDWFGTKQNILMRVDASVDEEELFSSVDAVLQQAKRSTPEVIVVATPPDEASDGRATPQDLPSTLSFSPSSNQELKVNLNPTESSSSLSTEKEGRRKLQIKADNQKVSSRKASMSSDGSSKSDKPLPPGVPESLYQHWKNVCEMYVNNIKAVMQELRFERNMINQHFLNIKEEFKHFLSRPDLRQEEVSHWQKDFNSVADDMRDDEETKAELHLRLDELCERLWNITDKRKEENEQERAALIGDGWLTNHTFLLVNRHSILLQVEMDRFRDTFFILKKYYLSMSNKPVRDLPLNLTTVSLVDASHLQDLETHSQEQPEHDQPQKKLVDDYEHALTAIHSLLPTTAQQREAESMQKEKAQENPPNANKGKKKPPSAKKKKGAPSPPPEPIPEQTEVKPTDKTMTEYIAALNHEEEAVKARITLVKGHGLHLVHFIQSNAEHVFGCMEEWYKQHFDNEMKSIEQLSEVVRHHIESGAKLQKQLVLDHTHFCLNGDFQMVSLPALPSRPPAVEKASQSALSVIQLESLCLHFRRVAPNGLLPCLEFSTLFKEILNVNKGSTWPESLVNMSEAQLMEIVALLKDQYEFVNWRRVMLSCAQPWPSPSVTQLLDALQQLKTADIENKGYVNEEQYLQTQLWFPEETVQEVSDDPSVGLPYDRLFNLHKFFFQVFADHSLTPPRLDYASTLRYLAADPNPKQGFVRALSVVVGQHLRQSSSTQLVKSMPSLEEVPEFSTPDLGALHCNRSESPSSSALLGNQKVSIPALLTVIGHSIGSNVKDSQSELTELVGVYKDLGYEPDDSIAFSTLSTHPIIQHLMESSAQHRLVNIYN